MPSGFLTAFWGSPGSWSDIHWYDQFYLPIINSRIVLSKKQPIGNANYMSIDFLNRAEPFLLRLELVCSVLFTDSNHSASAMLGSLHEIAGAW